MIKDKNDYLKAIEELNTATKAYDEGHPYMTDEEWDNLYFEVSEFERKFNIKSESSPSQTIFYGTKNGLTKVEHNHQMLSLAKTKDWNEFINYFDVYHDVIGMLKLDGLTCSLRYVDGKLVSAETRGNGIIGEDILHNIPYVKNVPLEIAYKDELILDGEIICTYKDFEKWSDTYANPRNFASGSIRLLEPEDRDLSFIVWNIVKGFDGNSFMNKLISAHEAGFDITPFTSSFDYDAKEFLIDAAKKFGYPIDGLVGRYDDILYGESLGATSHHTRAAFAFKFYDETVTSYLRNIEWSIGRTGVFTPVAIFDPVEIDGTVVERASLHNISIMTETLHMPYEGQEIEVYKSNMIIPQVLSGKVGDKLTSKFFEIPTICPCCGEKLVVNNNAGIITLTCNNSTCGGRLVNRLDHFCGKKGLDIKGLSLSTLEKLIDWGWINSYEDIFNLEKYKNEWINKPGFGQKSVQNILSAIQDSRKTTLESFISSLGIPFIGNTLSKELIKHISSYEELRAKVNAGFDFSEYNSFASAKTQALLNFDYTDADNVYKYLEIDTPISSTSSNNLEGLNFVITGKLTQFKNRAELVNKIESLGGKVVGSVSKNTNYLINNDTTSTSAKNLAAQKLEIPIISEQEFCKKFDF